MPVADRSETLIVSGTNEARQAINAMVRDSEQRVGTGQSYETLIRRDTTQAERRFAKNYNIGDAIQPERDYTRIGLERGHTYRVVENGPDNRLTVENAHGERVTFSPMVHNRLSVYALEKKEIAPGDRIRITRNDAGMDLANGDRFTVKSVGQQEIVLASDKREVRLPADKPLHVDYAYASTVHSAQGLTSKTSCTTPTAVARRPPVRSSTWPFHGLGKRRRSTPTTPTGCRRPSHAQRRSTAH